MFVLFLGVTHMNKRTITLDNGTHMLMFTMLITNSSDSHEHAHSFS